jgi:hypothetical protein
MLRRVQLRLKSASYQHAFSGHDQVAQRRFELYLQLCQIIEPRILGVNPNLSIENEFTVETRRAAEHYANRMDAYIQAQADVQIPALEEVSGFFAPQAVLPLERNCPSTVCWTWRRSRTHLRQVDPTCKRFSTRVSPQSLCVLCFWIISTRNRASRLSGDCAWKQRAEPYR